MEEYIFEAYAEKFVNCNQVNNCYLFHYLASTPAKPEIRIIFDYGYYDYGVASLSPISQSTRVTLSDLIKYLAKNIEKAPRLPRAFSELPNICPKKRLNNRPLFSVIIVATLVRDEGIVVTLIKHAKRENDIMSQNFIRLSPPR